MSEAMARYAGYRHTRSISYNPQSNGLAEQGVKSISDLLVRHTHHLRDWHLMLPMITFGRAQHHSAQQYWADAFLRA
eukprot:6067764-Pleurochrysis_carterae.AAC.1